MGEGRNNCLKWWFVRGQSQNPCNKIEKQKIENPTPKPEGKSPKARESWNSIQNEGFVVYALSLEERKDQ